MPSIGVYSKRPTARASRYEGNGFVCAKRMVFVSPSFDSEATGVFETASYSAGMTTVSWKGILKAGSSQTGKARRASMASNWVNR